MLVCSWLFLSMVLARAVVGVGVVVLARAVVGVGVVVLARAVVGVGVVVLARAVVGVGVVVVMVVGVPVPVSVVVMVMVVSFLRLAIIVLEPCHTVAIFANVTCHRCRALYHVIIALRNSFNHTVVVCQVACYHYFDTGILPAHGFDLLLNVAAHKAGEQQIGQYNYTPRSQAHTTVYHTCHLRARYRLVGNLDPSIVAPLPQQAAYLKHLRIAVGVAAAAPYHNQGCLCGGYIRCARGKGFARTVGQCCNHRILRPDGRAIAKLDMRVACPGLVDHHGHIVFLVPGGSQKER
jgi:hypothetical protein